MRFRRLRTRHVPCCKWSIAVDALTGYLANRAVVVASAQKPSWCPCLGRPIHLIAALLILYRGVQFAARIIEQMWYKVRTFATFTRSGRTDAEQAKNLCIPVG